MAPLAVGFDCPLGQGLGVPGTSMWEAVAEDPVGMGRETLEHRPPSLCLREVHLWNGLSFFLFWWEEGVVSQAEWPRFRPPHLLPSPVFGEMEKFLVLTVGGQQPAGSPDSPRQDLSLEPGRPLPGCRKPAPSRALGPSFPRGWAVSL